MFRDHVGTLPSMHALLSLSVFYVVIFYNNGSPISSLTIGYRLFVIHTSSMQLNDIPF